MEDALLFVSPRCGSCSKLYETYGHAFPASMRVVNVDDARSDGRVAQLVSQLGIAHVPSLVLAGPPQQLLIGKNAFELFERYAQYIGKSAAAQHGQQQGQQQQQQHQGEAMALSQWGSDSWSCSLNSAGECSLTPIDAFETGPANTRMDDMGSIDAATAIPTGVSHEVAQRLMQQQSQSGTNSPATAQGSRTNSQLDLDANMKQFENRRKMQEDSMKAQNDRMYEHSITPNTRV